MKKMKPARSMMLTAATAAATATTLLSQSALAGRGSGPAAHPFDPQKEMSHSSFEACKGVSLVDYDTYEKNKDKWQQYQKDCGADKVQILSKTGFTVLGVNERPDKLTGALSSMAFLEKVADRTKKHLEGNISLLKAAEACVSKKDSEAALKSLNALLKFETPLTCEALVFGMRENMSENISQLKTLMGASGDISLGSNKAAVKTAIESGNVDGLIPIQVGGTGMTALPSHYVMGSLPKYSEPEMNQVRAFIKADLASIRKSYDALPADQRKTAGSLSEYSWQELSKKRQVAYKAEYMGILQRVPLFTVLPKGDPTDAELQVGLGKLRQSTENELKRVNAALNESTSYTVQTEIDLPTPAATLDPSKREKTKSMLPFLGNLPVVESILAENPADCATATGLMNYASSDSLRGAAAEAILWLVPFGSVGKAAQWIGRAGTALTVERAGTLLGAGLGAGLMARDVHHGMTEMATTLEGAQAGVKKFSQVEEQATSITGVFALSPLNFIGIGGVGGAAVGAVVTEATLAKNTAVRFGAATALAEQGYTAKKVEALIRAANQGDHAAQKVLKETFGSSASRIFGTSKPEAQWAELAEAMGTKGVGPDTMKIFFDEVGKVADKAQRKKAVSQALDIFSQIQPGALKTPEERHAAIKGMTQLARYGEVRDPAKIAALYSEWPQQSKAGFESVLERANGLMETDPAIKKLTLQERREAAFKQALREKKVPESEIEAACRCTVCGGAARADASDIEQLLKNGHIEVCVKSGNTVWYQAL